VFLGFSVVLATRLGSEFLPALEEGNYWIRAALPPTLTLDAGTDATRKMRDILLRHHEILTVVSQHGRPDNGSDAAPFSNVELFAPLRSFDEWPAGLTKEKLTAQLQKEFSDAMPGVGFNFSQYIQDNVEEALSGVKGANSVKIVGPNLEVLEKLATQVQDEMSKVRGVQAAMGGTSATTVLEGDRQFNLSVRLRPDYRRDIEAIKNVKVGYSTGVNGQNAYIPLSELADCGRSGACADRPSLKFRPSHGIDWAKERHCRVRGYCAFARRWRSCAICVLSSSRPTAPTKTLSPAT
jgi:cobalt-zinc-cadmium resistance protein CzcA